MLMPDENTIVFYAIDESGNTAEYAVPERPIYIEGQYPDNSSLIYVPSTKIEGSQYAQNRLIAIAKPDVDKSTVEAAVSAIDGKIVGNVEILSKYYISVSAKDESELRSLAETLKNSSSFDAVFLDYSFGDTINETQTDDPWWRERAWSNYSFRFRSKQWGLTKINVPEVWEKYDPFIKDVGVGIVDSGFDVGNEDLSVADFNVLNHEIGSDDHGTHVLGTIGAIHNNKKGIAGVLYNRAWTLTAYDGFTLNNGINISPDEMMNGLAWNVVRGAKVINFSIGTKTSYTAETRDNPYFIDLQNQIKALLEHYDFLIVCSAGNGDENYIPLDAEFNSIFTLFNDQQVKSHIIVVGASREDGKLVNYSNFGSRVDVVAPGFDIWSTTVEPDQYGFMSGTSMASPHVAGVAALTWGANLGLSAEQVKEIIVNTARDSGRSVYDRWASGGQPVNHGRVDGDGDITYHEINALAAVESAMANTGSVAVGSVTGKVIDAVSQEPINGAVATLTSITHTLIPPGRSKSEEGFYSFSNLPVGKYLITVSADGYADDKLEFNVLPGVNTVLNTLRAIKDNLTGDGEISGIIQDATTKALVTVPTTLKFYPGLISDMPDRSTKPRFMARSEDGNYLVSIPAGNYSVIASAEGYIDTLSYVYVVGNQRIDNQNIVISPNLENQMRIVLTWDNSPADLDSYLDCPTTIGGIYTVKFWQRTNEYMGDVYAQLDVDERWGYGPETITIYNFVDGEYTYYVFDYVNNDSNYIKDSNAVVRVYYKDKSYEFVLPTQNVEDKADIWSVFKLKVANGMPEIQYLDQKLIVAADTTPRDK